MVGMFSVLKVRKDQKPGDYKDPDGTNILPEKSTEDGAGQNPRDSSQRAVNPCRAWSSPGRRSKFRSASRKVRQAIPAIDSHQNSTKEIS